MDGKCRLWYNGGVDDVRNTLTLEDRRSCRDERWKQEDRCKMSRVIKQNIYCAANSSCSWSGKNLRTIWNRNHTYLLSIANSSTGEKNGNLSFYCRKKIMLCSLIWPYELSRMRKEFFRPSNIHQRHREHTFVLLVGKVILYHV